MKPWRRLARAEAKLAGDATTVAGVDEAGRGPLAGPVVAAAVVLSPGGRWDGLNDSKQIDAATREALYARVLLEARAFAWAVVSQRAIDSMNIRRASLEAMRRAVARLRCEPDVILVDGLDTVPGYTCRQHAVIDGDARMLSIAAASVLAKVVRDRIMARLDAVWPVYGFARHKGYSTPEHLEVLSRVGPCPLHRYSYAPVRVQELPLFDAPPDAADEVAASAAEAPGSASVVSSAAADLEPEAVAVLAVPAEGSLR